MFGKQALSDESLFFSNLEMIDNNDQSEEEIDVDDYENMLKEEVLELPNVAATSKSIQRGGEQSSNDASSSVKNDNSEVISYDLSSMKTPAVLSRASKESKKSLGGGFFYAEPNINLQVFFRRNDLNN